jgi:hypothetical protein
MTISARRYKYRYDFIAETSIEPEVMTWRVETQTAAAAWGGTISGKPDVRS